MKFLALFENTPTPRISVEKLAKIGGLAGFWLDPDGNFYLAGNPQDSGKLRWLTHAQWAALYFGQPVDDEESYERLLGMGWVRGKMGWSGDKKILAHSNQPIGRAQLASLEMLGIHSECLILDVTREGRAKALYQPPGVNW